MPHRAAFRMSDLVVVEEATHEPIVVGDFVRLASGSPLGLIISYEQGRAEVLWLAEGAGRSTLAALCLRPAHLGADASRPTPGSKV